MSTPHSVDVLAAVREFVARLDEVDPDAPVVGELAVGLAEPRGWTVDSGIAWLSRQNVQWDVSAGVLVRGPGQSWFASAGVTLRRLPRRLGKTATDRTNS